MKIEYIMSDMDNVLVNITAAKYTWLKTLSEYKNLKWENLTDVLIEDEGGYDLPPNLLREFNKSPHRFGSRPPFPGVKEVLEKFYADGLKLFTMTATGDAKTKRVYTRNLFGDLVKFEHVPYDGGDKSNGIKSIADKYNLDISKTLFIDDLFKFIRQALTVPGLRVIRMQPEFYVPLPADLAGKVPVVKDMNEFYDYVSQINRKYK